MAQKVINGKVYDTATAEVLHSDSYSNPRDFAHWVKTLYRTKYGTLFIYGKGGPMSEYSRTIGPNEWSGGDGFEVLTAAEAIEWLEDHDGDDAILEYFGDGVAEA